LLRHYPWGHHARRDGYMPSMMVTSLLPYLRCVVPSAIVTSLCPKIWYHSLRLIECAQAYRYRASKGALSPSIIKSIRRWMDVLWGGPRWLLWLPRATICYHPLRSKKLAQTDRYRASKGALLPPIIKSIRRWMVVLWGGL
jgi:hypothetical protein